MNRKRNIVIVSALGIVALMLIAGWDVLADAAWPPEPMAVYSLAGAWIQTIDQDPPDAIDTVTISPEDPISGKGFCIATDVNFDFSDPEVDNFTPWFGSYIRTGPNTWQNRWVAYARKDTKPKSTVTLILILEGTWTMISPDRVELAATALIYGPEQDSDGDGLPDEGQQPKVMMPITGYMKPL
jgi:hypothetical protein